ncbi:MAG: glycosyltransferase, partial [Patescibacteria group bacterium]
MQHDGTVIVIPTYNERENIGSLVERIFDILPGVSVCIVDDNSPDGTRTVVKDLQKKFPRLSLLERVQKDGLGRAYVHAFQHILTDPSVERIITMDADFSHDPSALPELLAASQSVDVVVGSRYVPNGSIHGWEPWRRWLSAGGNWYSR